MSRVFYKKAKLIILVLWCCNLSYSQNLPSKNYTSARELPNNSIRALFLDSDNFLWIGTENGVVHKENKKFTHFFEEDGLVMNNCWAIAEDSSKKMWFGSYGEGLSIYNGNTFFSLSTENGLVHNEITKLFHFKDKMYVGTSDGISVVDINSFQIHSAKPSEKKLFRVSSFFEHNNKIYCTTYNSGVYLLNVEAHKTSLEKINNHEKIYAAFKVNDSIFSSNKEYFSKIKLSSFVSDTTSSFKKGNSIIWDYCITSDKKVFAGAWGIYKNDGGIYEIKNNTFINRNSDFNISSKEILSLAFDSKLNKLYVGSKNDGLYEVDLSTNIEFIPSSDQNLIDFAKLNNTKAYLYEDVLILKEGTKKIRLEKKILKEWQVNFLKTYRNPLPKHEDYFFELDFNTKAEDINFYELKSFNNAYWLNTSIGVFAIKKDGSFQIYLPIHTVTFNFNNEGEFIETSPYEGSRVYNDLDKFEYTYYDKENKNTPTMIVNSLKKGDKTYFLSIFTGLYVWQNGVFSSYLNKNIWQEKKLKHIAKINDYLAISNEAGDVFIINDTKRFNVVSKIPRSKIKGNSISFLESFNENLIIGTEKGLTIYKNNKIIFINEEQGLKQSFLSSKVEDETLVIGSKEGAYYISLNSINKKKPLITNIKLNEIKINNKNEPIVKVVKDGKVRLNYTQNTILLTYTINAHPYPEKLSYEYRLNSKSEWNKTLGTPEIFLPYLPPNNYHIDVRVTDLSTGYIYSQNILNIKILTPFWKTWWFMVSLASLFTIGSFLFYKRRIEQNKKIEEEKSLIKKRVEEVKMEALLAQMNPHFIFNAMNSIQKYIMDSDIDNAVLFLGEFSNLIRKNLDHCTRPYIFIYEEIEYLNSYVFVENKRFNGRISIDLTVDKSIDTYSSEIPSMIIQPFIENVFVHAFPPNVKNPKLTIHFGLDKTKKLVCTIKDNGVGISKNLKKLHKSKGILLIKERLKLLGYNINETLQITSSKEEGTTVVISLKI